MHAYIGPIFHVGYVVHDIERSMRELSKSHGLTWTTIVHRPDQPIWTRDHGPQTGPLTFVYSKDGPQRVELLSGPPGSPWDPLTRSGIHHIGVWADVAALTDELVAEGWDLECSRCSPAEGYGSYSYVRSPAGFLVEPVANASRERLERWWTGGPME